MNVAKVIESPESVVRHGVKQRLSQTGGGRAVGPMGMGLRSAAVALALASAALVVSPAWAGDDGSAPLWQGIGSLFAPVVGLGGDKPPPIDYRQHGKLVLPPNDDLPPPGSSSASGPAWPVNQEAVRRKAAKGRGKENARRSRRRPPALYARVPGGRARDHSRRHSGRTIGEMRRRLRIELIDAKQHQSIELVWNGKERHARPRA